jgi:hypothetical protein
LDGKLIAAGSASNAVALARYNEDGTLDEAFGVAGIPLCPKAVLSIISTRPASGC